MSFTTNGKDHSIKGRRRRSKCRQLLRSWAAEERDSGHSAARRGVFIFKGQSLELERAG